MNNSPFLSIIIPVYNAAPYLSTCIDSILQQAFTDYEVILIDDGSSDDSSVICDTYVANHPHIHCIHQDNSGHTAARQAGFRASKGGYVAFVDSDDWVSPDMYTDMCRIAKETTPDIVHCDFMAVMPDKEKKCSVPFAPGFYDKSRLIEQVYPRMIYSGTFFVFGAAPNLWNKLFRRDLLEKYLFLVPHSIKIGEDGLITYGCMLEAQSIYFTEAAYYYYRSLSTSLCHNVTPEHLADNRLMFETYVRIIDTGRYPMMRKQLDYFFAYQSLLTLIPVYQEWLRHTDSSAPSKNEIRKHFMEECGNPHIQRAFASVRIGDLSGSRNKIYAFCIRHRLFTLFALTLPRSGSMDVSV